MDPISAGILTGVLANALTPILGQLAHYGSKAVGLNEALPAPILKLAGSHKPIVGTIRDAILKIASTNTAWMDLTPEIRGVLKTPEMVEVVSQIYAQKLFDEGQSNHLIGIQKEIERLLRLHGAVSSAGGRSAAASLLSVLSGACDDALQVAINEGFLSAHEAKDVSRHKILIDRLKNVEKLLGNVSRPAGPSVPEILKFEKRYRTQVADRHRLIAPPQYDSNRRVPIERVFVEQAFAPAIAATKLSWPGQSLPSLFHRFVVLGQPGGGKSTYLQKTCYDLARENDIQQDALRTPILIVMREFGALKAEQPLSLVEFIEQRAKAFYQVPAPIGAFDYLLSSGRAIVLFDGLDELLDTSYRQEITADIEAFCNLYPAVPAIVTSRERGYEQAPLSDDRFVTFRLRPLDEAQISQYVTNLMQLEEDVTRAEAEERAATFLSEAISAADLLNNPLMLGLVVSLYRGQGFIPRNRPEVYEKCSEMLFTKWDARRRIINTLPFTEHLRPAIAHLAYWIYSDPRHQRGVTESQLIDSVVNYICPRLYDDQDKARAAASDFVGFCTGRAWVFTDTGTTPGGERLYEFTHRTFLEYFAALYVVRNYPSPEKLLAFLGDKIAQEEWDMVAQLACQILSKQQEDAADQIVTALLDRKSAKGSKHADVNMRFAATSLQYIIPSTRVRRLLTEAALRPYLRAVIRNWKNHSFGGSSELRDTMPGLKAVAALLEADQENQDTIWLALQEKLLRSSTTPLGIAIAIEVLSVLPFLNFDSSTFKEKYNRSLPMISTIAKYREKLFYESAREFFPIASIGLSEGLITVPELVEWHGLDSITLEYEHRACPGVHPSSLLEVLYHGLTEPHWYDAEFRPKILNIAKDLGRMLESIDPPWLQDMPMGPHFFHDRDERSQESGAPLPREFLFSAFAVVAIYTESLGRREKEPLQRLLASEIVFSNLRNTFAARVGDKNALKLAEAEISKSGLSPKQQAIALQWAHGNVSFISRTGIRERRHRIGPASA